MPAPRHPVRPKVGTADAPAATQALAVTAESPNDDASGSAQQLASTATGDAPPAAATVTAAAAAGRVPVRDTAAVEGRAGTPVSAAAAPAPTSSARSPRRPAKADGAAPVLETPRPTATSVPKATTLYLDEDVKGFLHSVRVAGMTAAQPIDVSHSAVVRLAVRALRERMTPAEIIEYFAAVEPDSHATGRKRR
ncbi:hypothetical protein [Kineococcus xinjiangensis]|nr:hypothetical protein [Kineococcus xinjiangensis]